MEDENVEGGRQVDRGEEDDKIDGGEIDGGTDGGVVEVNDQEEFLLHTCTHLTLKLNLSHLRNNLILSLHHLSTKTSRLTKSNLINKS